MAVQEFELVLQRWNATATPYNSNSLTHGLFERGCTHSVASSALTFEGEVVSYNELDQRSSKVAGKLVHLTHNIDAIVGLCVEKSVEEVAGMVAILRAQAAYIPLDASLPSTRLKYLLDQCNCAAVLAQQRFVNRFLTLLESEAILLPLEENSEDASCGPRSQEIVDTGACAGALRLAYVLFTSGSTGR